LLTISEEQFNKLDREEANNNWIRNDILVNKIMPFYFDDHKELKEIAPVNKNEFDQEVYMARTI
jgi:hypothetical protein